METVKMYVEVDKKLAILAGKNEYGITVVEVPVAELTPEELQILADLPTSSRASSGRYCLDPYSGCSGIQPVGDTSLESIKVLLQSRVEVLARQQAEKKARLETAVVKFLEASDEEVIKSWNARSDAPSHYWFNVPESELSDVRKDPRVAPRLAVIRESIAAQKKEKELRDKLAQEKLKEFQRKKKEDGEKALLAWATANGSERLKLMLELQAGDWVAVAREEFQDAHAPEGYTRGSCGGDERKKPTLAELKELRKLEELVNDNLKNPEINWVKSDAEYDEDGDLVSEAEAYAVVEVQVWSPDGDHTWYAKRIEEEEEE